MTARLILLVLLAPLLLEARAQADPADATPNLPPVPPGAPSVSPALAELRDGWKTVEPGGRTSCAHGDPFRFFVRPGDPDRVLLYLTGGGACRNAEGCAEGSNLYTQRVRSDRLNGVGGILDLTHPENPFLEHTMVVVPVCTGDVHLGDRDEVYVLEGEGGARREFTVRHRGLVNGMAALDWMAENLPQPREVFVAGGSAGAVATPVYASLLARRHPEARVAGLSDDAGSYIAGTRPLADPRRWGMADALATHAGWKDFPEGMATDRILIAAAGDLPNLRLYQLDHAHDRVQVFFHGEGGTPDPDLPALLRQARERIRSQVPTYRAFTLGGHGHQSLHLPTFYVLAQDGYRLRDWVAAIASGDDVPDVACSDCQQPGFVLGPEDVGVLEGALGLLREDGAWEPDSSRGCPSVEGRFTLGCALLTGVSRVSDDPWSSSAVLSVLYAAAARVPYDRDDWNPFRRFNDEVAASVHDVRGLLEEVLERARQGEVRPAVGAAAGDLPHAGYEDLRESAGRLEGGVLRVTLEAKAAEWRPWGEDGPAVYAHVFAADGEAPRVPGPLIRVHAGMPVHVTVRNSLPDTLAVRGLRDPGVGEPGLPTVIAQQVVVAPGSETEFRFTPSVPGTYSYGGDRLSPSPPGDISLPGWTEADRALRGVFIVDPPGEAPDPDERFFLITHWGDEDLPASFLPATRFFINGRSWPHTERLTYAQGDTIRWRVINFSGRPHPMHLHGFYFQVDARGDLFRERVFAPEERRAVVTEALEPAETMRMSWVATEPGNWIFHCHFMRHMSWIQTAPIDGPPPAHAHEGPHGPLEGEDLMGGLVLGVTVLPGADHRPAADRARRRLELFINKRDGVFGDEPAYGFVLGGDASRPAADSVRFPGSPLVLTRGEPTEIVVHNRADVPLGVHWHGLELESWADGVPGWSGLPGSVVPAIAPGDSLAVRMTPPRAGTFMYHVHSEPGHQLAQGLYGPFLVLEEGEEWDPERDRLFLLGSLGTGDDPPPAVNGRLEPEPEVFRAGETYRFRFMHISPDDDKRVSLLRDGEPVSWRHVAKDGADLPPKQVREHPAELHIHVGETWDFLWEPAAPGDYALRIVSVFDAGAPNFRRDAPPPDTLHIPVTVEGGGARAPAAEAANPAPYGTAEGVRPGDPTDGAADSDPDPAHPGMAAPLTPRFESGPCPFEAEPEVLAGIDCGHVTVPENWDEPGGRSIAIPVAVVRATAPDPRPHALVRLRGGPSPDLQNTLAEAAGPMRRDRDVIVFDYRGMGFGERVCPDVGQAYMQALRRPLPAEESLEARRRIAADCRAWAERHGVDLSAYNARNIARDVVAIVDALGYEAWQIAAISFGARVTQEILRLGPPGLGAVALLVPERLHGEAEVNGFARSLELMAGYCAREPECAAAFPDPLGAYRALYDQLEREPLPVPRGPTASVSDDDVLHLTGTVLHLMVNQMLYSRAGLAGVPLLLAESARGNPAPAAAVASGLALRGPERTGAVWTAGCDGSRAWAEGVPSEPHPALEDFWGVETPVLCEALGIEPPDPQPPVESDVPALIVVGEHDPVTPPAYAAALARRLRNATVIEMPGRGHETPASCAIPVLLAFFDDPGQAPDGSCFQELPDVPFAIPTGTEVPE